MLMEIFVALQSYTYLQQMPAELSKNLNETFVRRYNVTMEETQAIDYIQRRVSTKRVHFWNKFFLSFMRDYELRLVLMTCDSDF